MHIRFDKRAEGQFISLWGQEIRRNTAIYETFLIPKSSKKTNTINLFPVEFKLSFKLNLEQSVCVEFSLQKFSCIVVPNLGLVWSCQSQLHLKPVISHFVQPKNHIGSRWQARWLVLGCAVLLDWALHLRKPQIRSFYNQWIAAATWRAGLQHWETLIVWLVSVGNERLKAKNTFI